MQIDANRHKIIKLLTNFGIDYSEGGKNVSSDKCVGICCPFCGDHGFHGAIFLDGTHNFTCWKCKTNVSLYSVVRKITNISYEEFEKESKKLRFSFLQNRQRPKPRVLPEVFAAKEINFPDDFIPIEHGNASPLVKGFLSRRNYTIDDCVKYSAGYCKLGKYAHRFIIPVYSKGKLVAFQGRDMTGKSKIKYQSSDKSLNPINNFLYGYDNTSNRIIVVEGVFDKWRLGDDAVCTFGASLSKLQSALLIDKKPGELIFAWERDKYHAAKAAAKKLKIFIEKIKVLLLPSNSDPDALGSFFIENAIKNAKYL